MGKTHVGGKNMRLVRLVCFTPRKRERVGSEDAHVFTPQGHLVVARFEHLHHIRVFIPLHETEKHPLVVG